MIQTLTQFNSLFRRDGTIDCILNHINRSLAALVNERCDIEMFAGMCEDVFGNRPGRLSEDIRKDIMKLRRYLKSNIPVERIRGVANARQGWYRRAKLPIVNFLITPDILAVDNKKENRPGLIDPLKYYLRNT